MGTEFADSGVCLGAGPIDGRYAERLAERNKRNASFDIIRCWCFVFLTFVPIAYCCVVVWMMT